MSEKAVNQLLSTLQCSKYYRDRIRALYGQIRDINRGVALMTDSSIRGDEKQSNVVDGVEEGKDIEAEVDASTGIIELAKIFDPEDLEKYLSKLNDEELESVFRINVEAMLANNMNNENKNEPKFSNEDILTGWIFKFRAYVKRFHNHIKYILDNEEERMDRSANTKMKRTAETYVNHCLNSLENIKTYYHQIYAHLKGVTMQGPNIRRKQEPFLHPS